MNMHDLGGVAATIVMTGLGWFVCRRFYKRIARRCRKKDCGRTDVQRISKIFASV